MAPEVMRVPVTVSKCRPLRVARGSSVQLERGLSSCVNSAFSLFQFAGCALACSFGLLLQGVGGGGGGFEYVCSVLLCLLCACTGKPHALCRRARGFSPPSSVSVHSTVTHASRLTSALTRTLEQLHWEEVGFLKTTREPPAGRCFLLNGCRSIHIPPGPFPVRTD